MKYDDIGSGRVLVLIHGLGSHKGAWRDQHELSDHFRLIIPTLRGHGDSEERKGITVENFALDILNLLDELDIKEAVFCGLSMGGIVAQEIYRQRPSCVKGLILSNTLFYSFPYFNKFFIRERERHIESMSKEEYAKDAALRCTHQKYNAGILRRVEEAFLLNKEAYMQALISSMNQNNTFLLLRMHVPVLIITGTCDNVTPFFLSLQMKCLIPKAKLVVLRETGHLANIESRVSFNLHVSSFMQTIKGEEEVWH